MVETSASKFVLPRDESFISRVQDDRQRQVMTDSVTSHRRADRLSVGDALPMLMLTRLDAGTTVPTTELAGGRPLVLIFGSYT